MHVLEHARGADADFLAGRSLGNGAGAPLLPRRLELRLEEVARNRDFACARYAVVR